MTAKCVRMGPARSQIDALRAAGRIRDARRNGLDLLALTAAGRRALEKAQSAGAVILPESPQHRKWRHSRTMAGDRIAGFRESLRTSLAEVGALLDAEQAPSDAWFEFGKRLSAECRRLGSATYGLFEWAEPDDARADVDEVLADAMWRAGTAATATSSSRLITGAGG